MLPSSPDRMPGERAERMLITRITIAVGLALLLVVGAWSNSHGTADVHASLCLAPGVSHAEDASTAGAQPDDVIAVDVLSSDIALCLVAVLCGVVFVLLFRRLLGGVRRAVGGMLPRGGLSSRAGPRAAVPALTLTQLSISRT